MRKEETSWASEGSKGVLWKALLVLEGEDSEEAVDGEDFRPVNISQTDILRGVE